MRAGVAEMVPPNKRGSAYGVFSMQFGVYWFLGSVAMGWLYDVSIPLLVAFSVVTQAQAVPLFFMARKREALS
jgi:predicted MFS family arabinose efflux permease